MSHNKPNTENVEDPKLAIILSYLRRVDEIENLIDNGRASDALRAMCTFINRLYIPETYPNLIKAKEDLNNNQKRSFICASSVQGYFALINNFLNETSFADFHGRAKPRNPNMPTLKLPEARVSL